MPPQQRSSDPMTSQAPPGLAAARTPHHLEPNISFQTACKDRKMTNLVSQYRYPSETSHLIGERRSAHCYDVQTACPHAQTQGIFWHTFFQIFSTGQRTHLLQCYELDDFGRKPPKSLPSNVITEKHCCSKNRANQFACSHDISIVSQRPTCLARPRYLVARPLYHLPK